VGAHLSCIDALLHKHLTTSYLLRAIFVVDTSHVIAKFSRHLRDRRLPREVEARVAAALVKEANGRAIPINA
jgi:hypothetical protein